MRVMVYLLNDDPRLQEVENAAAAGLQNVGDEIKHGNRSAREVDDWTQMAVFVGKNIISRALFDLHVRAGRHVLLIDEGYIDPAKYWRFGLDGFQSPFLHREKRTADRLMQIMHDAGLTLVPPQQTFSTQNTYVYIGASEADCDWHRLGPPHEFDSNLIRKLVDKTINRQYQILWYARWKQDDRDIYMPRHTALLYGDDDEVRKQFKNARVIVTHSNRLSIEALMAGKRVGILSSNNASPLHDVCENDFERMWTPRPPTNPEQALANMAHWQFTLNEIESGYAFNQIEHLTVKRTEYLAQQHGENDLKYLIAQYKLMHELPNRYRGGLQDDVLAHITNMVEVHRPKNMLDYGSGKGRQYGELAQQAEWGGRPVPVCYDPGVPEHSAMPKGPFDGVICTDVAEHIPEQHIEQFLRIVTNHAKRFVVWCIYTGPAAKALPDGRNAHLTVRPPEWWLEKLAHIMPGGSAIVEPIVEGKEYRIINGNLDVAVVFRSKDGK